jgi:hypothetical protein
MLQLTKDEFDALRSQFVTVKSGTGAGNPSLTHQANR